MNKKYKKIYIELINYCNLNCKFCVKTNKPSRMMTLSEFTHIIDEVKPFTDYIYLHVQGEPLLHPQLDSILNVCKDNNIFVNMTTNSILLKENLDIISNNKIIRQMNISLQALQDNLNSSIITNNKEYYYDNIIELIKKNPDIYVSLRLWGNFEDEEILKQIKYFSERLNPTFDITTSNKLIDHVFFSLDEEFTWPNLNNPFNSCIGHCKAISQLAILVDGTVVPCCLDKDGIIDLGNVFKNPLKDILTSNRYNNIINGFRNNQVTEELCRHCTYLNRFSKSKN